MHFPQEPSHIAIHKTIWSFTVPLQPLLPTKTICSILNIPISVLVVSTQESFMAPFPKVFSVISLIISLRAVLILLFCYSDPGWMPNTMLFHKNGILFSLKMPLTGVASQQSLHMVVTRSSSSFGSSPVLTHYPFLNTFSQNIPNCHGWPLYYPVSHFLNTCYCPCLEK